jgi:hypothetical protein
MKKILELLKSINNVEFQLHHREKESSVHDELIFLIKKKSFQRKLPSSQST